MIAHVFGVKTFVCLSALVTPVWYIDLLNHHVLVLLFLFFFLLKALNEGVVDSIISWFEWNMFAYGICDLLTQFTLIFTQPYQISFSICLLIAALTLLGIWRMWKFTILSALKPNEPKEIPYWVPCKSAQSHELIIKVLHYSITLTLPMTSVLGKWPPWRISLIICFLV